jgi:hypothetical protein
MSTSCKSAIISKDLPLQNAIAHRPFSMLLLGERALHRQRSIAERNNSCQSEFRICVQGYEYDSEFEGPQGLYALWHSACDGAISYTPTTPPITSLSATAGVDACLTAESNCAALGLSTESCTSSYSLSAELQHCFCQPAVLDLASRCEIDGSVSCLLKTPVSTNLWSYKQCRSAEVVSRTHSTAVVSSQVHLTAHTKSTATPPIASKASSATSASQTSAAGHTAHSLRSVLTFVAIWTLACVL